MPWSETSLIFRPVSQVVVIRLNCSFFLKPSSTALGKLKRVDYRAHGYGWLQATFPLPTNTHNYTVPGTHKETWFQADTTPTGSAC